MGDRCEEIAVAAALAPLVGGLRLLSRYVARSRALGVRQRISLSSHLARQANARIFAVRPNWSMPAPEWVTADRTSGEACRSRGHGGEPVADHGSRRAGGSRRFPAAATHRRTEQPGVKRMPSHPGGIQCDLTAPRRGFPRSRRGASQPASSRHALSHPHVLPRNLLPRRIAWSPGRGFTRRLHRPADRTAIHRQRVRHAPRRRLCEARRGASLGARRRRREAERIAVEILRSRDRGRSPLRQLRGRGRGTVRGRGDQYARRCFPIRDRLQGTSPPGRTAATRSMARPAREPDDRPNPESDRRGKREHRGVLEDHRADQDAGRARRFQVRSRHVPLARRARHAKRVRQCVVRSAERPQRYVASPGDERHLVCDGQASERRAVHLPARAEPPVGIRDGARHEAGRSTQPRAQVRVSGGGEHVSVLQHRRAAGGPSATVARQATRCGHRNQRAEGDS